eukprot:TRINITY_DN17265_c1_g4_i1.p1 TRINITY_DN17265_c1_g4~~TRINITY_DN17265_c1_g4_i1.p1  ORF type:complete len:388 (-),score=67.00 TRINITY_DN17265_c1_g4_i1:15-1178(-)
MAPWRVSLVIAFMVAASAKAAHSKQLRANRSLERSQREAASGEISSGQRVFNFMEHWYQYLSAGLGSSAHGMTSESSEQTASQIKLLCFAWAPFRKEDVEMLKEVRDQLSNCDGHAFFTDKIPDGIEHSSDIHLVSVPEQAVSRSDPLWLYHRNMVGLMPAWAHLLETGTAEKYDWVINVELDHFVRPSKVKSTIYQYLHILRNSSEKVDGPMMLGFGNAFLFNRKVVQQMKSQWGRLGKVAPQTSEARGCPMFQEGLMEWPQMCSQDVVFPTLARALDPPAPLYGGDGCGFNTGTASNGVRFPFSCWEMRLLQAPGNGIKAQKRLVEDFKKVRDMKSKEEYEKSPLASKYHRKHKDAELLYDVKDAPIIHHLINSDIHKLVHATLR